VIGTDSFAKLLAEWLGVTGIKRVAKEQPFVTIAGAGFDNSCVDTIGMTASAFVGIAINYKRKAGDRTFKLAAASFPVAGPA
jgi:hypothetical protein